MKTLTLLIFFAFYASQASSNHTATDSVNAVMNAIIDLSVTPTSTKELEALAIQGMLGGLQSKSYYIPPEQYKAKVKKMRGKDGYVGIRFVMKQKQAVIVSSLPHSPARSADVRPHDILLAIDGQSLDGKSFETLISLLHGPAGEPIELKIKRPQVKRPLYIKIKRAPLRKKTFLWKIFDNKLVYIRLNDLNTTSASTSFVQTAAQIEKHLKTTPKGLILDLRNNPGGVVAEAIKIADFLLPEKLPILIVKGKGNQVEKIYYSGNGKKMFAHVPIVVLINSETASAAEMLASALKENNRAFLMGNTTHGKGTIQTIIPISHDEAAISLTTGYYFSPKGHPIEKNGVAPHEKTPKAHLLEKAQDTLKKLTTP